MTDDEPEDPEVEDTYEVWLRELWAEDVRRFDRAVLALAGGTLALSATFVRDLAASPAKQLGALAVGWVFLLAAVFFVVGSYIPSKVAIEARFKGDEDLGDKWSAIAWGLSLFGGASFGVGAGFLAWFALVNVA
jgi:hypothetical protein